MEFFKAKSTAGKIIFYVFEICALILTIILFTTSIYNATKTGSFMVFLSSFSSVIYQPLIIYGVGRTIDLLCA